MPIRTGAFWMAALLAALSLLPGVARAQVGAYSDYLPSGYDDFSYAINSIYMRSIFDNAERRAAAKRPAADATRAAGTVVGLGVARVPRKLAHRYPPERRAEAARTFQQVLDAYQQVEVRLGIPKGDVAGAFAALIAGSWSTWNDRDIPDAGFQQAVRQLRGAIARDPGFAGIGNAGKQEAYEQFAILGTSLALTRMSLQRQPDPQVRTRMHEAARGYLGQFGLDPDRIDISVDGLALR